MASASSKSSTAFSLAREAEHGGHVLRRLAHPHRLDLGVADDHQRAPEGVRHRFGADRLAGAGGPREVERERETGGVPLAQAPAVEDQLVARHLSQRLVERAACRFGQDDVVERASWDDRVDRPLDVREAERAEQGIGHQPQRTRYGRGGGVPRHSSQKKFAVDAQPPRVCATLAGRQGGFR
jgi:hypothetical protein